MSQALVPVQVGSEPPEYWDSLAETSGGSSDGESSWHRDKSRPAIANISLKWKELGFDPRWIGFDSADCAAALQPSVFHGRGADEFDRFRKGAEERAETALVISPIGGPVEGTTQRFLTQYDDSVHLGGFHSSISSKPLGTKVSVRAAQNLDGADKQLSLRLLSTPNLKWRALTLDGMTQESAVGRYKHQAAGELHSIVETELGEPVVAVWLSPDRVERRYMVPFETPWTVLLPWLLESALPEYVPGSMRRARRLLPTDTDLMSKREIAARTALADLEENYVSRKVTLERESMSAEAEASPMRDGLLYGSGNVLVDAVRSTLELAGVEVTDLDDELGGTKNADLLCRYKGAARLVEVKSASGSAPERAYDDLVRHLREWEALPKGTPVDGGVLVLNHQLRTPPRERSLNPYNRPEFLAAQTEFVVTTLALFDAWRLGNSGAVRHLIFGAPSSQVASTNSPDEQEQNPTSKRRWFRRD